MLLSSDSFKWCCCDPGSYMALWVYHSLQRESVQHTTSPPRSTTWEPIWLFLSIEKRVSIAILPLPGFWVECGQSVSHDYKHNMTVLLTLIIFFRTVGVWGASDFLLVGVSPLLSGVLGGKFSSNNSGLRWPPKDTRLLFKDIPSLLSEVRNTNMKKAI